MARRSSKTEAVVLRSIRFGEADRVLHLYTLDRGRIGAVAKGVRKTKSRFGARLEPLSHVGLVLHEGGGELQTITGVDLIRSHRGAREDPYRLAVGLVGLEAMLRLFSEQERNERAFEALTRFLDVLDDTPAEGDHVLDALGLSFSSSSSGSRGTPPPSRLRRVRRRRGSGRLLARGRRRRVPWLRASGERRLSADGLRGIDSLLRQPLAQAHEAGLSTRARRDALGVITSSYEYHGGFRLRTLRTATR